MINFSLFINYNFYFIYF